MSKLAIASALAAALLIVGCNETSQKTTSTSSSSTSATVSGIPTGQPAGDAAAGGNVHKLASGLQYEDLVVGNGKMAETGMNVAVHYTGWLTNGTEFDSSLKRGTPYTFQLGSHTVIQGWDEGIKGMRVGGKRKLTIPPDMGYGAGGSGPIPPNATLLFDVELVDAK